MLLVNLQDGSLALIEARAPRYRLVELPALRFDRMEALLAEAETWEGDFVRIHVPDIVLSGAGQGFLDKLRAKSNPRWFHVVPMRTATPTERAPIHTAMPPDELLRTYMTARPFEGEAAPGDVLAAGLRLLSDTEKEST